MRGTWVLLAAGAGAGVWLAAEHGWLAWLVLSAAAAHAVGVLAYCLIVRQQTGRHCQGTVWHCQGTVWHCSRHCQCTVTPTVTPTVPPTVLALSDSAVGGHRRIVRGQLTAGQGSGAVGNGGERMYTGGRN